MYQPCIPSLMAIKIWCCYFPFGFFCSSILYLVKLSHNQKMPDESPFENIYAVESHVCFSVHDVLYTDTGQFAVRRHVSRNRSELIIISVIKSVWLIEYHHMHWKTVNNTWKWFGNVGWPGLSGNARQRILRITIL